MPTIPSMIQPTIPVLVFALKTLISMGIIMGHASHNAQLALLHKTSPEHASISVPMWVRFTSMKAGLMTSQDDALLDALPSVMPTQVIQIMYVSIPVLMDSSPLKYSRLVWLSALMTPSPATIQRNVWFYVPMVNTPMSITKYAWTNATSTTANSQITPPTCASNNVPPNPTCSPRRAPMNASCFVRLGSSPT